MNAANKMDCILLHGWGVTNQVWEGFITKFDGFDNILTPCLYSIARQSKDKSFKSVAKTLSKIIKKDSVLVTWSIGGLIALRLLPLTKKVKAIIFIASTPCFLNQEGWPNVIQKDKLDELKRRFFKNEKGTLSYFSGLITNGDINPSQSSKYVRQYLVKERQNEILSFWLNELEADDQRKQFATMGIPSHTILGENDVLIKSKIKNQIENLNSSSHCTIIQDCGHTPFVSKPKETYNLIYQFLNERI
tara:strand:- start:7183 stop:7923 length:741 start_codon:yes stop_codon:yes gene_type:complete